MAAVAGRRLTVVPDIGRGKLAERRFAIAAGDERKIADGRRRMAGRAYEPRVLVLRDGKTSDEKLADEDAMDGPLVLFCIGRAHEEIAGWDARQVWRCGGGHLGARGHGAAVRPVT